jgi:hypothetical protein
MIGKGKVEVPATPRTKLLQRQLYTFFSSRLGLCVCVCGVFVILGLLLNLMRVAFDTHDAASYPHTPNLQLSLD